MMIKYLNNINFFLSLLIYCGILFIIIGATGNNSQAILIVIGGIAPGIIYFYSNTVRVLLDAVLSKRITTVFLIGLLILICIVPHVIVNIFCNLPPSRDVCIAPTFTPESTTIVPTDVTPTVTPSYTSTATQTIIIEPTSTPTINGGFITNTSTFTPTQQPEIDAHLLTNTAIQVARTQAANMTHTQHAQFTQTRRSEIQTEEAIGTALVQTNAANTPTAGN